MPHSEKQLIIHLEEQITQLENVNKDLTASFAQLELQYKNLQDRNMELYQEAQELKNQNPFRIKKQVKEHDFAIESNEMEAYSILESKYEKLKERELKLNQEINELKRQNPFTLEKAIELTDGQINGTVDEMQLLDQLNEKKEMDNTKKTETDLENGVAKREAAKQFIKVNYAPLLNVLQDIIEADHPIAVDGRNSNRESPNKSAFFYQIVSTIKVDFDGDTFNIDFGKIHFDEQAQEEISCGKELKMKMDKKKEAMKQDGEKEIKFVDNDMVMENGHELIKQLQKEMNEIKELLKDKKTEEIKVMDEEAWLKNEQLDYEEEQKVTFRDIQDAEQIQSIPSKKPNTITNVKRNIQLPLQKHRAVGSQMNRESEQVEKKKTVITKPKEVKQVQGNTDHQTNDSE